MGAQGEHGGIDGEMCASSMHDVINCINEDITNEDKDAFGFDMGHGTGVAAFAYFNYGLNLNMIGVESNNQRCLCSWILQKEMLLHCREDFRNIAGMSKFYLGDGFETMRKLFEKENEASLHLKLLYWFRAGWDTLDVQNVINFVCETFSNLTWIVCDMSVEQLFCTGFRGDVIFTSKVHGLLNKSSNSRTLFVHKVKIRIEMSIMRSPTTTNKYSTKRFDFRTNFISDPTECIPSYWAINATHKSNR
jgi:hypothetical protein